MWNRYIRKTDHQLIGPSYEIRQSTEKCAVIVEPRRHPHLSYVLRNIRHYLDPEWGLMIFHSRDNKQMIDQIVSGWGDVQCREICEKKLGIPAYNKLFSSSSFWQQIPAEHILIFQTDALMRRRGIDAFLDYDFIGAPFPRRAAEAYGERQPVEVGCGGISLRRKQTMIKVCDTWPNNKLRNEDIYFGEVLLEKGYNLPSPQVAGQFSVEASFHPDPLTLHKPWPWLTYRQMKKMLSVSSAGGYLVDWENPLIDYRAIPERFQLEPVKTYVINLAASSDRMKRMEARLCAEGIEFERFEGVDGSQVSPELFMHAYQKDRSIMRRKMSDGEFGNFLSHRRLWEKVEKTSVIFEDDVKLAERFSERLTSLIAHAPEKWDIIYLGCCSSYKFGPPLQKLEKAGGGRFVRMNHIGIAGNYAYLLSPRGARKLLEASDPIPAPTDHFVRHLCANDREFYAYAAIPEIAYTDGSDSLIKEMGRGH